MAHDSGSRRSMSPDSPGRNTPTPRQWRNQLSADDVAPNDKHYRKYASGVERTLALFDTALDEWADYISFLTRLLKALQARQANISIVPSKALVAKRLSQCLDPSLPSGVHQKAIEVYDYIFSLIGENDLSRDLPLYLSGLAPTLSFASLTVRTRFLDLLEKYLLRVEVGSLRPAMKSIIMALLPGLEDDTSEDFDRTLNLIESFKRVIRPPNSQLLTDKHSTGDDFFWQCFFLATITSGSRRPGGLAYLTRNLPQLGPSMNVGTPLSEREWKGADNLTAALSNIVTSPEPGLLLRCFAAGLGDEQILIQRGFLDLLVSNMPLNSKVLQKRVKSDDLALLLRAAAGVVIRRDMSLNRRLWAWFLGPEQPQQDQEIGLDSPISPNQNQHAYLTSKTSYFEEYGLQQLTDALLGMINGSPDTDAAEKAKPYRICLSLMDRWEIGGLVVPEIFLPVIMSVKDFKSKAKDKAAFSEVLRSASVFFDGVESGLIYGELVGLMAQAMGPGGMSVSERVEKLALVQFVMTHFNIREEEMITLHAPLTALCAFAMVEDVGECTDKSQSQSPAANENTPIITKALDIAMGLIDLVPERTFFAESYRGPGTSTDSAPTSNSEILKKIKHFYVSERGNLEAGSFPFHREQLGDLLIEKACNLVCSSFTSTNHLADVSSRSRLLVLLLSKTSPQHALNTEKLLSSMHAQLAHSAIPFASFKSVLSLAIQLHHGDLIPTNALSDLVDPLVRHAWAFLSAAEPKYHVETVRCLWHLQTALTLSNRDIEASIANIMLENDVTGTFAVRVADPGRSFSLLWSHTLQDNASHSDRRSPKTTMGEPKSPHRLSGMDYYEVMLTRPLFLMLDALVDERTQLFMVVKHWLNTVVGIEKLFLVFVKKLSELRFLCTLPKIVTSTSLNESICFADADDLDLGLYYIRTLSNTLRWSPDALWGVLATRIIEKPGQNLSEITGTEGDISLQEYFVHICLRCIAGNKFPKDKAMQLRTAQLHRTALTLLHQILLSPYADRLSSLKLESLLIDRLAQSLEVPDPYIQVLLLDVVFASLRLRDASPAELPSSPTGEKRALNHPSSSTHQLSLSVEHFPDMSAPPASLLKCIQSGLSSPNSRSVLDSWVGFLAETLPLYSSTIFQVLIPLVGTLCDQISYIFDNLQKMFRQSGRPSVSTCAPESTLISLLNALEQLLAKAHDQLLMEESRAPVVKSPDQPQGFFGNMVSGVFNSDAPQSRSATANDRLTVLLAFQDAVRICFKIWSWGQGDEASQIDPDSSSSFKYTSLRMRNRARRLLEHVFTAEALECLETVIDIWRKALAAGESAKQSEEVFNLLPALDGSRPRHTIPAVFNAIYSRTNPSALDPSRRSTMTVSLQDTDLVIFLVDYARSLEDDAMDEIWQDCMVFLKDLLGNPFPQRQTLPSLLEFAAILGEKVDNTNFGEQRKMRRELGDLFLRLLTALFTTRPTSFTDALSNLSTDVDVRYMSPSERADDVVGILARIVPNLPKILVESDRVLTVAQAISTNLVGPSIRSKGFPDTITRTNLMLLQELTRLPGNQKTWKKDVGDAFNDPRFFNASASLVRSDWLPLLKLWTVTDKDRMTDILSRISSPTTAGIVFGVGATSARLEADRKTQLNLRRIATLVLACGTDTFVTDLPAILGRIVDLLGATTTSSPSSTTRADIYMVLRALVLRTSAVHLAPLWPIVNSELHAAISSVAAPDNSPDSDTYSNLSILHACKLLDLLLVVAPDDFQLHEWLFITDTIDAIYRSATYQPIALIDELSEELGNNSLVSPAMPIETAAIVTSSGSGQLRRPLLGPGRINDELTMDRKDELVVKILRPFFGQLSIYTYESTYAMGALDIESCMLGLLGDLFDDKSIVKAL
ncbi:putative regulator of reproduction dopa [Xylaria sp. CBS 124048]|nr:putative regulator of reproduction dopa [Xylaria sp. CBS 124048]